MTNNQIAYKQAKEQERSNRAKETETHRSNRAKERIDRAKVGLDVAKQAIPAVLKGFALNDPSWYNMDKTLTSNVANISYNAPLGSPVKNCTYQDKREPGIMVLSFIPTLGNNGGGETNVANIAAKNIYAYVRYANSGARNYESTDLMKYILAVDQAYSYHGFLSKVYSLVRDCKSDNRYYIDAMLKAHGINPRDIRQHIPELRYYINSYGVRLNSFYVPENMPFFKRHYWMNSVIFKDSPVKKSQDYVFLQRRFGEYIPETGVIQFRPTVGTTLIENEFLPGGDNSFGRLKTYASLTALGEHLLNQLISDEDIGIMSGDILKAYGESKVLYVQQIPDDYHIESVYSEEVLSQIDNATMVGDIFEFSDASADISEITETNTIYQGQPLYSSGSNPVTHGILATMGQSVLTGASKPTTNRFPFDNWILNMYKDNVSEDDNMVSTRLTAMIGSYNNGLDVWLTNKGVYNASTKWGQLLTTYGTEIILYASVITLNSTTSDSGQDITISRFYGTISNSLENPSEDFIVYLKRFGDYVKFNWGPVVYLASSTDILADSRDVANYASVNRSTLNNMHYNAVLSEFGVPLLGSQVRRQ